MTPKRKKSFDPKSFLAQVGDGHSIGKYGKGQVVFSQGDTGDAVFYIQKGKVKTATSAATPLRAFIRSLSYCRQKAKHSNIALRTPTSPTNV